MDGVHEGATVRVRYRDDEGHVRTLIGVVVATAPDGLGLRPWGTEDVITIRRGDVKHASRVGGATLEAARAGIEAAQARALARRRHA